MSIFTETIALLIKADARGAIGPMRQLESQATQTADAWDKAGKKIGVSGAALKSGIAGLTAGLAIDTIVRGLGAIATEYADAAKSAGDLAAATGGTIEQVSAMQAALVDAGVSAEQSAAMLTKFATAAGTVKGADTLRALNVELVRGQSGAVDYAATMTVAVDQIMALGDAAQRNTALVALFGRQGAAAFQDLIASGLTFAEAQRAIDSGRILTGEDYQNAVRYDQAIDDLNASMEEFATTVGRDLLPALTAAAEGLSVLADVGGAVEDKLPFDFLTRAFPVLMLGLKGVGALFGDTAAAENDLQDSTTDTTTAMQALTAVIASGATSGAAFADAVAAAGDELAAQDASARLAAQALDIYRASTDQAYEATLKLLGLERSERSAQRSAEGAADAAGDAKANMDQALADAKAAKTVVENIAAIQGRARRRREEEGIIEGSTDVSAVEGIKGRAAQRRTRVIEAAGVITPAEARQIREATRQYEESLDNIAAAWLDVADARIKHKEALGLTLTEAEKLDEVRKALREGLKVPGLSKEAKDLIKADLKVVEDQIKALGGVPITIEGIKFKPGTTEAEVKKLQASIAASLAGSTERPLGENAQAQLDSLKVPGVTDLNVALGLDPASVAATQAALGNVGIDPKTGKPYTAKTVATVDTSKAKTDLDNLTKPRTMTVTVNMLPGTGFPEAGGPTNIGPVIPGLNASRLRFGGGASFNPTVNNYYPKPERASDSVASSLRVAKYMVGV